jgi:hypothetical protein
MLFSPRDFFAHIVGWEIRQENSHKGCNTNQDEKELPVMKIQKIDENYEEKLS